MRRAPEVRSASTSVKQMCSDDPGCTNEEVTRAEFAVLLSEALGLAPVAGRRFSDVRARDAEAINAIVDAGIMSGCGDGLFCPNRVVRRAQVATYLNRAL